jgi:ABC-type multidrug transport system ATPase subunit
VEVWASSSMPRDGDAPRVAATRENLQLMGRLSQLRDPEYRPRAGELLQRFDLAGAADRPVRTYSGGMRRRLDVAAAQMSRRPIMFWMSRRPVWIPRAGMGSESDPRAGG